MATTTYDGLGTIIRPLLSLLTRLRRLRRRLRPRRERPRRPHLTARAAA